jgi:hypothetical protein
VPIQSEGYSLFRHLARALWPGRAHEGAFVVYGITSYYDACSKEEVRDRPMVLAGVVATEGNWTRFEERWASILATKGIDYFDTAACSAWSGKPYSDWNRDHNIRNPFLSSLAEEVKAAAALTCIVEIIPADFEAVNRVYTLDQDEHWPSPYPMAAHACMGIVNVKLPTSPYLTPGFQLAHVIEYGDRGQGVIRTLIEKEEVPIAIQRKWNKQTGQKVHAFAACDLVAFYARYVIERRNSQKTAPDVIQVLRQIPLGSVRLDQETLVEICERAPHLYPKRSPQ